MKQRHLMTVFAVGVALLHFISVLMAESVAEAELPTNLSAAQDRHKQCFIGKKAPEFNPRIRDRVHGSSISLDTYKGKWLLLYSFNAGNFVEGRPESDIAKDLSELNSFVKTVNDPISIVGFTRGVVFFFPNAELSPEIKKLSEFPVVNLNNRNLPLQSPYDVLKRPSGILINPEGEIERIISSELGEKDYQLFIKDIGTSGTVSRQPVCISQESSEFVTENKKVPRENEEGREDIEGEGAPIKGARNLKEPKKP